MPDPTYTDPPSLVPAKEQSQAVFDAAVDSLVSWFQTHVDEQTVSVTWFRERVTEIVATFAANAVQPGSLAGQAGSALTVNTAEDALEFLATSVLGRGLLAAADTDAALGLLGLLGLQKTPRLITEIDLDGLQTFNLTAAMLNPAYDEYIIKIRNAQVAASGGANLSAGTSDDDGATIAGAGEYQNARETFNAITNPPTYLVQNPANFGAFIPLAGSSASSGGTLDIVVKHLTRADRGTRVEMVSNEGSGYQKSYGVTTLVRAENNVEFDISSGASTWLPGATAQIFGVPL